MNNPTNFVDPTGHSFIGIGSSRNPITSPPTGGGRKSAIDVPKVREPDEEEETGEMTIWDSPPITNQTEPYDDEKWVRMIGTESGAHLFFGGSATSQLAWDSEGNYGLVETSGMRVGAIGYSNGTKYTEVYGYDLTQIEGTSFSFSGSVSVFLGVAGEGIIIDEKLVGWSTGLNFSVPFLFDGNGENNWSEVEIYDNAGSADEAWDAVKALYWLDVHNGGPPKELKTGMEMKLTGEGILNPFFYH